MRVERAGEWPWRERKSWSGEQSHRWWVGGSAPVRVDEVRQSSGGQHEGAQRCVPAGRGGGGRRRAVHHVGLHAHLACGEHPGKTRGGFAPGSALLRSCALPPGARHPDPSHLITVSLRIRSASAAHRPKSSSDAGRVTASDSDWIRAEGSVRCRVCALRNAVRTRTRTRLAGRAPRGAAAAAGGPFPGSPTRSGVRVPGSR